MTRGRPRRGRRRVQAQGPLVASAPQLPQDQGADPLRSLPSPRRRRPRRRRQPLGPLLLGLLAGSGHWAALAKIAASHPGLKLLVDHLGRGGAAGKLVDDAVFADLEYMLALARHPNIAIKLSAAPSYSSQPYPYRNKIGRAHV